jgi:Holliday junction resolvase RusA-like endonuclease
VFELRGEPRGKGRPRSRMVFPKWGGKPFINVYTDAETTAYEDALRYAARAAMRGRAPTDKPLALLVHAFMSVPKSWPNRDYAAALAGAIRPTGKPDADNFLKIVDALNPRKVKDKVRGVELLDVVVWTDDSQVVDGRVLKFYSDKPALRVEVRELVAPNP